MAVQPMMCNPAARPCSLAVAGPVERPVRLHLVFAMLIHGWLALLLGTLAFVGFVVVGAVTLKFALFIAVKVSDAAKPSAKDVPSAPSIHT